MADRPIQDLPEHSSFNDRIRDRSIKAGDIFLPVRANNRSVRVTMDGPLFVPQPEDADEAARNKGARLTTFQEDRRWGRSYVVWDSAGDSETLGKIEGSRLHLYFPDPNMNLFHFSDISFVTNSSGHRTPWYSLMALTNRMRDKSGNLVYMSGSPRIQGLEVTFTGDPLTLVKGPSNILRVYVR